MEEFPDIPNRGDSLVVQTVRWLRAAIEEGRWNHHLPGERALARRLDVSRSTLRLALSQLEADGWIEVSDRKRRKIISSRVKKDAGKEQAGIIGLLLPESFPAHLPGQAHILESANHRLSRKGYRIKTLVSPACFRQRPGSVLSTLIENNPVDAWLLMRSPPEAQRWFVRNRVPCVVSGSCEPGVSLPSVDIDHGATARHAVGVLARAGRTRLALIRPEGTQPGDEETEREFVAAARAHQRDLRTRIYRHENTTESVQCLVDGMFHSRQVPDGVVCALPSFALTVLTHLQRRGIRVPEDISLVSRSDAPLLEFALPRISAYRASALLFGRQLGDSLVEVARAGFGSVRTDRQLAVHVPGESV